MPTKKFMDNLSGGLSRSAPGSFAVETSGEMDNTSADALEATQAGMSYGQWKALHPHTKELREAAPQKKEVPKNEVICKHCGKTFIARRYSGNTKYCSDECRKAANNKKAREYQRRKAENGGKDNGKLCAEN